ncbi:ABC transporter permease [Parascardovia denticolens]
MALWVSFSDWSGRGDPFSSAVHFIGGANYQSVLATPGLSQSDFGTAIRNNAWYTLLVIPLQTILSLLLAIMLNRKILKARGFFRTAFYFPSVTSSVAITVLWLFLFNTSGSINAMLAWFGAHGPNWFNDPDGILHLLLRQCGLNHGPQPLTAHGFLGISWWDWLSGPSVAMFAIILMVVFTTSGTFMLMFIAALQNIGESTEEAAIMDGTNEWQRMWKVTIPQLKPTIFTVITLGIIGTWQVFDQIYTGTQGGPSKTTLTPAYLSYTSAFNDQQWGQGAAISFILFVIIVLMTVLQRFIMRDKPLSRRKRKYYLRMKEQARAIRVASPGISRSAASTARSSSSSRAGKKSSRRRNGYKTNHLYRLVRDHCGRAVLYLILIFLALIYISPFLVQIATSFKTDAEASSSPVSLTPQVWSTAAYQRLFLRSDFPVWFRNSVLVTLFVTAGRVFFDSLAGYALSRLRFPGRNLIYVVLVGVMSVPTVVLLIPKFLIIKYLGIYDTYAGMILPLLVDASGVFIMRNFFESVPRSVEEQAKIDRAGTFRIFWSVVLPMARPTIVTIAILSFQGSWNELSHFIISTQSPALTTLTKGVAALASGQLSQGNQYPLKLAAAVIMTLPVAIVFFIFRKRIMNVSEGAVKD